MRGRESVVVVGVDYSPASVVALQHTSTEAGCRGGSVEAVTAWEDTRGLGWADEERLYRAGHRWAVRAPRAPALGRCPVLVVPPIPSAPPRPAVGAFAGSRVPL